LRANTSKKHGKRRCFTDRHGLRKKECRNREGHQQSLTYRHLHQRIYLYGTSVDPELFEEKIY